MILIDYKDRRPIYEQIIDRMEMLIIKGVLKPNDQLPSVRSLAVDLSINPNTIQKAYSEMERLGYIYSVKGKGNYVAEKGSLMEEKRADVYRQLQELIHLANDLQISNQEFLTKAEKMFEEVQL